MESKRGSLEEVRARHSPLDESFHRGGSRGSAEWGKNQQQQQQSNSGQGLIHNLNQGGLNCLELTINYQVKTHTLPLN